MPQKRKREQWDYRSRGLVYHKTFIALALSRRLRKAAEAAEVPVSRLIAEILQKWDAEKT